jgi:hypothetical protein
MTRISGCTRAGWPAPLHVGYDDRGVLEEADLLLHWTLAVLDDLEPVGSEGGNRLALVRHDPTPLRLT